MIALRGSIQDWIEPPAFIPQRAKKRPTVTAEVSAGRRVDHFKHRTRRRKIRQIRPWRRDVELYVSARERTLDDLIRAHEEAAASARACVEALPDPAEWPEDFDAMLDEAFHHAKRARKLAGAIEAY